MSKTKHDEVEKGGQFDLNFTRSIWVVNNPSWKEEEVSEIKIELIEEAFQELQDDRVSASKVKDNLEWILSEDNSAFSFNDCFIEAQRQANSLKSTGIEKYEKYYGVSTHAFKKLVRDKAIHMHANRLKVCFFEEVISDISNKKTNTDVVAAHLRWIAKDCKSKFSFQSCFNQLKSDGFSSKSLDKKYNEYLHMEIDGVREMLVAVAADIHKLNSLSKGNLIH